MKAGFHLRGKTQGEEQGLRTEPGAKNYSIVDRQTVKETEGKMRRCEMYHAMKTKGEESF